MKSHLTRRVFRRLLLSQPVVQHRSVHNSRLRPHTRHEQHRSGRGATRTFFGIFQQQAQRDVRAPRLDPGMEKMLELDKRIHLKARLPPGLDLKKAFKDFLQAKSDREQALEDFHVTQLLQTLKALEEADTVEGQKWLEVTDLAFAMNVLRYRCTVPTEVHIAFAQAIYSAVQVRDGIAAMDDDTRRGFVRSYIKVLSSGGHAQDARDALVSLSSDDVKQGKFWAHIFTGLCQQSDDVEIANTISMMKERDIRPGTTCRRVITLYYARKNDVTQTKAWYSADLIGQTGNGIVNTLPKVKEEFFSAMLEFCLRNKEMEWGRKVHIIPNEDAGHETVLWNGIVRAAAGLGRGVDEIDNMLHIMVRRAKDAGSPDPRPSIDVFNDLINFALSRNDAYTAERYYVLAEKWNVAPNARTHVLRVEYRIAAGDIPGARAAYAQLRQSSVEDNKDWAIMNRLLRVLLQQPDISNEAILSLIEDVTDRRRTFPPDTVIALCDYHLHRNEYFEVVDLLQTYAYQYSTAARIRMRDHLVAFTLDPSTDIGSAWDTYMIFHQIFDLETHRDIRNQVMTLMFDQGRPDLASHVFTTMSRHSRETTRPNVDTYIRAFEGIAKTQEAEALEVIHNLLKLDTETEPSTRLYNSLMLAYTACDVPWRALEFWEQIATSDEGPSYESLHIAFRACERAAFGYRKAKSIWAQLRQADAEITREMFASYVGALAGQSLVDDYVEEVKRMPQTVVGGGGPDEFTIGAIFNASIGINTQLRAEQWARQDYPDVWARLEQQGIDENESGIRTIQGIDRSLHA